MGDSLLSLLLLPPLLVTGLHTKVAAQAGALCLEGGKVHPTEPKLAGKDPAQTEPPQWDSQLSGEQLSAKVEARTVKTLVLAGARQHVETEETSISSVWLVILSVN